VASRLFQGRRRLIDGPLKLVVGRGVRSGTSRLRLGIYFGFLIVIGINSLTSLLCPDVPLQFDFLRVRQRPAVRGKVVLIPCNRVRGNVALQNCLDRRIDSRFAQFLLPILNISLPLGLPLIESFPGRIRRRRLLFFQFGRLGLLRRSRLFDLENLVIRSSFLQGGGQIIEMLLQTIDHWVEFLLSLLQSLGLIICMVGGAQLGTRIFHLMLQVLVPRFRIQGLDQRRLLIAERFLDILIGPGRIRQNAQIGGFLLRA
jgi:hypothetical protein